MDLFIGLVVLFFFNYFFVFYFNNIFKFFILIILFYFSFFLFFLLPFLLSCVADRVLVLQSGVRPEPLRWDSQVQDIGPPETPRPLIISIGESSPRVLHLSAKTQLHFNDQQAPVLDTPCQTTSKTGTRPLPLAERLPKKS